MTAAKAPSASLWRRLCRSLCREQGAKDAVMVALMAIVLGALALQLGLGPAGLPGAPRNLGLGPLTSGLGNGLPTIHRRSS